MKFVKSGDGLGIWVQIQQPNLGGNKHSKSLSCIPVLSDVTGSVSWWRLGAFSAGISDHDGLAWHAAPWPWANGGWCRGRGWSMVWSKPKICEEIGSAWPFSHSFWMFGGWILWRIAAETGGSADQISDILPVFLKKSQLMTGGWFQTWLDDFSISYMGCHPSHWLIIIFFKMGTLHHQAVDVCGFVGFQWYHWSMWAPLNRLQYRISRISVILRAPQSRPGTWREIKIWRTTPQRVFWWRLVGGGWGMFWGVKIASAC